MSINSPSKPNVLFVCIHNSARSQMAEAFLKAIVGDRMNVYSAGLEAGSLNPYVVEAMHEIGIDISGNVTKTVNDPLIAGRAFDYVVTVCQESRAATCPIFPTNGERQAWHFSDPGEFSGSAELQRTMVRSVRNEISERVSRFASEIT